MIKAAVLAIILGSSALVPLASADEVDLTSAMTTTRFVDGIGVNVHMTWLDTSYANADLVERNLAYLGIRHLRGSAPPHWWTRPYEMLASKGYRFDFFIPVMDGQAVLGGSLDRAAALETTYPGSVALIEGPNEVNYWPAPYKGGSDLASAALLQTDLFADVKAHQVLKGVTVAALTLGGAGPDDYLPLGDLSEAADVGNAHIYFPAGKQPSSTWDRALSTGGVPTKGMSAMVTETGYYDLPDGDRGVSSAVQATRTLNLLAVSAKSGVGRSYLYQLMDPWTDRVDAENRYGLFRSDGSPKPVADAIRSLTRTLSKPGTGHRVRSLSYELENAPATTSTMILSGENGRAWPLAWAKPENWNVEARALDPVPDRMVTLTLDAPSTMTVYDPAKGETALSTTSGSTATFPLSDRLVAIAIDPSGETGGQPGKGDAAWFRLP